jgi:hypothetical protein
MDDGCKLMAIHRPGCCLSITASTGPLGQRQSVLLFQKRLQLSTAISASSWQPSHQDAAAAAALF